jgi:hypothetical protein
MLRDDLGTCFRTQQPLGFDYDEGHSEQNLIALAGIPLLVHAFRSLDPRSVGRHVCVRQRQRGPSSKAADGA